MPASPPPHVPPEPALQTAARLLAEGRPADAVAHLAALVAEAPAYAVAHVLHATALEAAGLPEAAAEAWSHAALLVPRSPLVRRERQRLAAARATSPDPVRPDDGTTDASALDAPFDDAPFDDAPFDDAPFDDAPAAPTTDDARDEPAPLDLVDVPAAFGDAPANDDLFSLDSLQLPETDTPLFEDDDEEPAAAPPAPDAPPPVVDWGDLPPLSATVLPPESLTTAPPPAFAPEPDDWRVVEERAPEPPPAPAPTPDVAPDAPPAFGHPFAPPPGADDLDALISRLEQAPRIRPDPAFRGPEVRPDDSGVDEMVSETLAKIYAAQHRYVEAAVMYEKLAARDPAQADEMLRRAADLRQRS